MTPITPSDYAHGKDTLVTLGGDDITALVNTTSLERTTEDGDVTTFADAARRFIPGIEDNGEVPLEGPFTPELYAALVALKAVNGTTLRITAGGGEEGMPYVEVDGFVNKLSGSFAVGDPAGISASFKVDGEVTDGVVT